MFISYSGPLISGLSFNVLNVTSCSNPFEIICPSYNTFVNLIVYSVFDSSPMNSAVCPAKVPFPTSYVWSTVPELDTKDNCALFTFESGSTETLNFKELFVNTSFSNVIPTLFVLNILFHLHHKQILLLMYNLYLVLMLKLKHLYYMFL